MPRERGGSGQYVETVTLEDVLAVFDDVDGPPVVTSADVAEATDLSRDSARRKLNTLEGRGDVARRKTAGRVLYWPTDWRTAQAPADDRETRPEDSAGETDVDNTPRRESAHTPRDEAGVGNGVKERHTDAEGDLPEDVRTYLKETDTPPKTDHGRSAVVDVFRYLREHGTVKTGELQDAVYSEYAEEWGSPRTMWNALDRYLEDVPGIEKAGYGEWGYAGDETVREELGE